MNDQIWGFVSCSNEIWCNRIKIKLSTQQMGWLSGKGIEFHH
jgi:hypothetical protein